MTSETSEEQKVWVRSSNFELEDDTEILNTAAALQGLLNLSSDSEDSLETSVQLANIKRHVFVDKEDSIEADIVEIKSFFEKNCNLIKVLETLDEIEVLRATKPLLLSFHHLKKCYKKLRPWFDIIQEAALHYPGSITFSAADYSSFSIRSNWHESNYSGVSENMCPSIYGIDMQNNQYEFQGFLTVDGLRGFANKLLNGELFKSEPLPESDFNENQVIVAVGYNLNDIILQTMNDVFVTFYTTWCQFSEELLPRLDELANLLQHDNIVIIKINAELNHVPLNYNVFCYPRSFYIPKDKKNHLILYDCGPRTIENLIKFIAKNSTKELTNYDRKGVLKNIEI